MSGDYITDEAQLLDDIKALVGELRAEVAAIRVSQEMVEQTVMAIVDAMKNNPMLASLGLRL